MFFPVAVIDKIIVHGGLLEQRNTRSTRAHERASFKEFDHLWDIEHYSTSLPCSGNSVGVLLKAIFGCTDDGFNRII